MKVIPFGTNSNNKKQAVFVALHAKYPVWENYSDPAMPEAYRKTIVPLVLMVNRWENKLGFPGGEVDKGETLISAALRELREEVGIDAPPVPLKPVVSHEFSIVTHLFSAEVDFRYLIWCQKMTFNARDYGSEITGTKLAHLMHDTGGYTKGKGLTALFKTSLCSSVKEELAHLIVAEGILPDYAVATAWRDAGHPIEILNAELLKRYRR